MSSESDVPIPFPYYASGEVVEGFGRGSKRLGIPTANFSDEVVDKLPENAQQGVYWGWASVENGPVHRMVMSIGKNLFYNNEKKTMETHIMHKYDDDFYGSNLKIIVLGFLRPMWNFTSESKHFLLTNTKNHYKI
jgi:riboflavin kinase